MLLNRRTMVNTINVTTSLIYIYIYILVYMCVCVCKLLTRMESCTVIKQCAEVGVSKKTLQSFKLI
jgi:hypothetical protein